MTLEEMERIAVSVPGYHINSALHEAIRLLRVLEAERDALRADAARYRAWRTAVCNEDSAFLDAAEKYVVDHGIEPPTPEIMDMAIDAAIAAKEQS